MRSHRGGLVLGLGIGGILLCPFIGVAAWVMGSSDLEEMEKGTMDPSGRGLTNAGKICGMISTLLAVFQLLIGVTALAFGLGHELWGQYFG